MKNISKYLKGFFFAFIVIALLFVLLGETDVMTFPAVEDEGKSEFGILTVMELLTICFIPLSLYLFRIPRVRKSLLGEKEPALKKYGLLRLCLLGVPLVLNTFLYYYYMNVSFGYMAIILLICMVFVYPSEARCVEDTTDFES